MKYIDEYRDAEAARSIAAAIDRMVTNPWTIMEVCGGQTHAIVKYGIDRMLPDQVELLHGPGCPVCVTSAGVIDKAIEIAGRNEVILTTFGDMLRVPGSSDNLLTARSRGADVRIVYSPLDAVEMARANPDREVVFFGVGFETTAPTTAVAVETARRDGVRNFSLLVAHVLVPPAIEAILSASETRVQGFLAAGHVCTIMGYEAYRPIAAKYKVPIVVTGFEPLDILQGVWMCLRQLEGGRTEVENQYTRSVREEGNQAARDLIAQVFEIVPRHWRGVGDIAASGFGLSDAYRDFDAEFRYGAASDRDVDTPCLAGQVLQGRIKPDGCPAFGTTCTPDTPLGAPMVSSEGACAAYYAHRRLPAEAAE
jgi:hydrogenase expression/formation protein HypD